MLAKYMNYIEQHSHTVRKYSNQEQKILCAAGNNR